MIDKYYEKSALTGIFVYGSLLAGESNHRVLQGCKFLGEVKTKCGYELVNLGLYPAMVIGDGQKQVKGALYLVSKSVLRRMDHLEGHPDYYRRVHIALEDGRKVQSYLLPRQQAAGFPLIDSGDWRTWKKDEITSFLQSL